MDPNQQPQPMPPLEPQQQPMPAAPQPVPAPTPTPMPAAAPQPPVAAQPAMSPAPAVPQQPAAPVGSQPFPAQPGVMPAPGGGGKSPLKLILTIAGGLVGVVLVAVIGWLVYANLLSGVPLEDYSGNGYSLKVPKDYKKSELTNDVTFTDPKPKKEEDPSEVIVSRLPNISSQRSELIDQVDKTLTKDKFQSTFDEGETLTSFHLSKTTVDGNEARRVDAGVKTDKETGKLYAIIVYGQDTFYYVIVTTVDNPALDHSANTILSSFKIN